jgi:hypothetical protein
LVKMDAGMDKRSAGFDETMTKSAEALKSGLGGDIMAALGPEVRAAGMQDVSDMIKTGLGAILPMGGPGSVDRLAETILALVSGRAPPPGGPGGGPSIPGLGSIGELLGVAFEIRDVLNNIEGVIENIDTVLVGLEVTFENLPAIIESALGGLAPSIPGKGLLDSVTDRVSGWLTASNTSQEDFNNQLDYATAGLGMAGPAYPGGRGGMGAGLVGGVMRGMEATHLGQIAPLMPGDIPDIYAGLLERTRMDYIAETGAPARARRSGGGAVPRAGATVMRGDARRGTGTKFILEIDNFYDILVSFASDMKAATGGRSA